MLTALKAAFEATRLDGQTAEDWMDSIDFGIGYEAAIGESVVQPNHTGLFLLYLWERFVVCPVGAFRMARCKHENMVCDGHGGPDGGHEAGHCPDCGFSFYHKMY